MEKFLRIAVTDEQTQLVSAKNVLLVEQASATTVTITYAGGKVITITHATAGADNEAPRDAIQDAIVAALGTDWKKVAHTVTMPFAVSGIAVA